MLLETGATILFQGDSITDCGRDRENQNHLGDGYAQCAAHALAALYPEAGFKVLNRGVSGNRVKDLLARYDDDFAAVKPDVLSILIGINDVWRRYDSADATSIDTFTEEYRQLLSQVKRDLPNTRIVIMEPFLLHVQPGQSAWREDLDPKIQVVRALAAEFADCFIPLDALMSARHAQGVPLAALATDGVHPTPTGHGFIAREWLKATGCL